jgi:hypothetical protein
MALAADRLIEGALYVVHYEREGPQDEHAAQDRLKGCT